MEHDKNTCQVIETKTYSKIMGDSFIFNIKMELESSRNEIVRLINLGVKVIWGYNS
jgi:hypothetical protein